MTRPRLGGAAVTIGALVVAAAVVGAIRGGFTDLLVYQYGGRAVLDGLPVYGSGDPVTGLPFTYPPFAAVVMVPLALLPAWLAAALWTGASVGALAAVVVLVRRALGRPAPGWLVALLAVGALALEPVWQNFVFGQVNLVLMLAVLVDLVRPERRWSGVLVGIAAGVKLTPLVFVVLLVLVGRRTAAGRAVARLRRHRRDRVRGDAGLVGDVLDRRPRRRGPGRPTGAGPQPVGVRRADPAARRSAADPAVARGRRAARSSRSWSSAPAGGGAATGCSAPAWERWRCCSPRRSRGRTTGCGRCRSRWCCGSAAGGRPSPGPRCSWPARWCGRLGPGPRVRVEPARPSRRQRVPPRRPRPRRLGERGPDQRVPSTPSCCRPVGPAGKCATPRRLTRPLSAGSPPAGPVGVTARAR